MNEDIIPRIFCDADDFCKALEARLRSRLLPTDTCKAWFPSGRMALSEGSGLNLLQPYQNRLRTLVKRCRGVHLFVINKFRPSPANEANGQGLRPLASEYIGQPVSAGRKDCSCDGQFEHP